MYQACTDANATSTRVEIVNLISEIIERQSISRAIHEFLFVIKCLLGNI
jgi:hypothetical protein